MLMYLYSVYSVPAISLCCAIGQSAAHGWDMMCAAYVWCEVLHGHMLHVVQHGHRWYLQCPHQVHLMCNGHMCGWYSLMTRLNGTAAHFSIAPTHVHMVHNIVWTHLLYQATQQFHICINLCPCSQNYCFLKQKIENICYISFSTIQFYTTRGLLTIYFGDFFPILCVHY